MIIDEREVQKAVILFLSMSRSQKKSFLDLSAKGVGDIVNGHASWSEEVFHVKESDRDHAPVLLEYIVHRVWFVLKDIAYSDFYGAEEVALAEDMRNTVEFMLDWNSQFKFFVFFSNDDVQFSGHFLWGILERLATTFRASMKWAETSDPLILDSFVKMLSASVE